MKYLKSKQIDKSSNSFFCIQKLISNKIIPVLRYESNELACYAAEIAIMSGCEIIELTWTIPQVLDLIIFLREKYGNKIKLGVGTILNKEQAIQAVKVGVDFLVSPCVIPEMIKIANEADIVSLSGALTPNEILEANKLGSDIVKIFPANTTGSKYIKSLKAVFPSTLFCPTGGITMENFSEYLNAGASFVGIGSNLYDEALFLKKDTNALIFQIKNALSMIKS